MTRCSALSCSIRAFCLSEFRTTFAVRLLQKGVSLESVAALLGNSVRVAERHYAPWVQFERMALEESVKKTWS